MAVNPSIKVVGPFSPQEFSDTSALSTAMDTAIGSLTGSSVVAVDPVIVLGNVYLICTSV